MKLALGTVQFGLDYGINNQKGRPDMAEIENILIRAYEAGIRCLDTAEAYGNAHHIIGDFHKKHKGIRFDIITKIPANFAGNLSETIDSYLGQLNVEKIESILFHSYDTYKKNRKDINRLNSIKKAGKIESVGVSVYTNTQIENLLQDTIIDIIQLPFNLLDNIALRGAILEKAKQQGKIIHARSAFLQGLFFLPLEKDHRIVRSLKAELILLHKIASEQNISMQSLAINYCLQQELINKVLIGVENLDQLNQNLSNANNVLSADAIDKINKIRISDVDLLNPSLWN
jgi:aryl-alcohol dehydrogenase-like predicted oxidoreductase